MDDLKGNLTYKKTLSGKVNYFQGKDGDSAYDVAVQNGFEGSEAEWLKSLRGSSGVYVGAGDMPEDCNVQIDPTGDALSLEEIIRDMVSQINKISTVTLPSSQWIGEESPYHQVVNILGATENSKIDLNPTVEQLNIFHEKDISFVVGNRNGEITVYCIGQKPANDYTIQVSITEVKRYE